MDEFLSLDRVLADLKDSANWRDLDEAGLARLAHQALFYAGRGHARIEPLLGAFYREYAQRIGDARRGEIFWRIRDLAHEGVLRNEVLIHFVRSDPEPGIVSTAALDAACLAIGEHPQGARGADYVLKLVVTGAVLNSGAALGGLLALGDEDVNWKLALLRPALALPTANAPLAQMASCATGYVYAATIEFWLGWMEAAARELPSSRRVFDWAVHGLARQREAMIEHVVLDGKRIYPVPRAGEIHEPGFREIPLAVFAASIADRLRALETVAPGSENLARALAAWLGPTAHRRE